MRRNGWIKLWHDIADKALWLEEPFTRAQAWIDLQLLACDRWDEQSLPGDVKCSLRFLARRWQWSTDKVKGFLRRMAEEGRITFPPAEEKDRTAVRTLLHLENYGAEQGCAFSGSDKSAKNRSDFPSDFRTPFRTAAGQENQGLQQSGRTADPSDIRTKSREQEESILEEYRRPRRNAGASGEAQKKIPPEYLDRFASWEEYMAWRYQ